MSKRYYVYIMASKSKTLYVGVTNNLERRVYEHKQKLIEGFTSTYNVNRLVYFAETNEVTDAIAREKEIKGWLRVKKVKLIEELNPYWEDLSADWFTGVSNDVEMGDVGRDSSLRSE
jgi:putative endonuclease